jgi:hypothetical protein
LPWLYRQSPEQKTVDIGRDKVELAVGTVPVAVAFVGKEDSAMLKMKPAREW